MNNNIKINSIILEGNPVREFLKIEKDFDINIVGYIKGKKHSFFNPYVPYLIAKKSKNSVILLPQDYL